MYKIQREYVRQTTQNYKNERKKKLTEIAAVLGGGAIGEERLRCSGTLDLRFGGIGPVGVRDSSKKYHELSCKKEKRNFGYGSVRLISLSLFLSPLLCVFSGFPDFYFSLFRYFYLILK